jgi:chlorite dismutase
MEEDASRITYFHGQERLGAKCAAFIPVRKKQEWWDLDEEERCAIRDESGISPSGVPPFVRKLHFSRDLGEPFDFLSWYEFQPEDSCRFEKFVESMRNTEEWKYVEREVDLRLLRVDR